MKQDKILITGANGQLGKCLKDAAAHFKNFQFLFEDKTNLDITNSENVLSYFKQHQPDYIINCAAYTPVDKAETEQDLAFSINEAGIQNLVEAVKSYPSKIVHISTDYVFDGSGMHPYKPNHSTNPQGIYGLSKAKGEQVLLKANLPSIIVRTSWVYSEYGHNFFKTMTRLGAEKENLNVVNDQIGCPTYAGDLAYTLLQIISSKLKWIDNEIYHYSNCGKVSWYDFAMKIMELNEYNCTVNPIPTSEYPTPAKRPAYSVLSIGKIAQTFGLSIPFWTDSLKKCHERFQKI